MQELFLGYIGVSHEFKEHNSVWWVIFPRPQLDITAALVSAKEKMPQPPSRGTSKQKEEQKHILLKNNAAFCSGISC